MPKSYPWTGTSSLLLSISTLISLSTLGNTPCLLLSSDTSSGILALGDIQLQKENLIICK